MVRAGWARTVAALDAQGKSESTGRKKMLQKQGFHVKRFVDACRAESFTWNVCVLPDEYGQMMRCVFHVKRAKRAQSAVSPICARRS